MHVLACSWFEPMMMTHHSILIPIFNKFFVAPKAVHYMFVLVIGTTPTSGDLLPFTLAPSLESACEDKLHPQHGDSIYVSIQCTNSLALSNTVTSAGSLIASRPPDASHASATFHPQSRTAFPARDVTQAARDVLEFDFIGFTDGAGISVSWSLT